MKETQSGGSVEDTRFKILKAAAEVFKELGYSRSTTKLIAARAQVNEVTIFRHFGTKEKLFHQVVDTYGGVSSLNEMVQDKLSGNYRQDMMMIAVIFMKMMMQQKDAARLLLCEASQFPEVRAAAARNPRMLREVLTEYIAKQIQQGNVVSTANPEILAQAFYGMIFSYGILVGILDDAPVKGITTEEVARQFVDVFVDGTINRSGEEG
ncbi:MAG: TetR/AcrR family transcriptional regulator [Anaerolineaceae bacterium]|nr:TetR/AcrR family transcriptional regulator [Anaerolineaceae bacterium]